MHNIIEAYLGYWVIYFSTISFKIVFKSLILLWDTTFFLSHLDASLVFVGTFIYR